MQTSNGSKRGLWIGLAHLMGFTLFLFPGCKAQPNPSPTVQSMRLVTFNLRYGTALDGSNQWKLRRDFALDTIEELAPDVLALQEVLDFQADEILERFPHLQKLGQHRDGGTEGEFSGLFVDIRRFEIESWGELWLSETPVVVASRGWDAALPRMAVWARLRDRTDSQSILVFGTHLDHQGKVARLESARLLAAESAKLSKGGRLPVALLGDFNAAEDSAPCDELRAAGFRDSFRLLHPDATEVGTFHRFQGTTTGAKIDYVWLSPGWRVDAAAIARPRRESTCPSDHDPVFAVAAPAVSVPKTPDRRRVDESAEFWIRDDR